MMNHTHRFVQISYGLILILLLPVLCNGEVSTTLAPAGRLVLPDEVTPLEYPVNNVVVVPGQGILFSESNTNRIFLLDGQGNYLDETGGTGFGNDSFLDIADLSNGNFELWVNDPLAGKIIRLDRWLSPLDPIEFYEANGSRVPLERPLSSARSKHGDVLILEGDHNEILLLDNNLELIEKIGQYGDLEIPLEAPSRIAYSETDLFAIADPGQKKVILFNQFGSFVKSIKWTMDGSGPTGLCFFQDRLLVSGEKGVVMFDLQGNEMQRWSGETFNGKVYDIAVTGNMLIVASDTLYFYNIRFDQ